MQSARTNDVVRTRTRRHRSTAVVSESVAVTTNPVIETPPPSPPGRSSLSPGEQLPSFRFFDSLSNSGLRREYLTSILDACTEEELLYVSQIAAGLLQRGFSRDFLFDLPAELALHVLSFVEEPQTLTQAMQVSKHWYRLTRDESIWRRMCYIHGFDDWDEAELEWRLELERKQRRELRRRKYRETQGHTTDDGGQNVIQYRQKHNKFLYRRHFKVSYVIQTNWRKGGYLLGSHTMPVQSVDTGTVTSVALDAEWVVVGFANAMIKIFSAHTGVLHKTLVGHESGVWCVSLISKGGHRAKGDNEVHAKDAFSSLHGKARQITFYEEKYEESRGSEDTTRVRNEEHLRRKAHRSNHVNHNRPSKDEITETHAERKRRSHRSDTISSAKSRPDVILGMEKKRRDHRVDIASTPTSKIPNGRDPESSQVDDRHEDKSKSHVASHSKAEGTRHKSKSQKNRTRYINTSAGIRIPDIFDDDVKGVGLDSSSTKTPKSGRTGGHHGLHVLPDGNTSNPIPLSMQLALGIDLVISNSSGNETNGSSDEANNNVRVPAAEQTRSPNYSGYQTTYEDDEDTREMSSAEQTAFNMSTAAHGWGQPNAIVISGGCDQTLRVWDVASGQCIYVLHGHTATIRCMKPLENRPIAVTGSRDGSLRVWDIQLGRCLHTLEGHESNVRCLDVFGNKVVSGSYDNTCRLWNVDTGECLHVLRGHLHRVYSVAFDGVRIASGGLDTTVRIWDAGTGQCVALLQGHSALVCEVQLSPTILATGGSDGRVITFSLETYQTLNSLSAHDLAVTSLQFDKDYLVTGSNDGRVKLFETQTGNFVRELSDPSETVWKAVFVKGTYVVMCRREGRMVAEIWSLKPRLKRSREKIIKEEEKNRLIV